VNQCRERPNEVRRCSCVTFASVLAFTVSVKSGQAPIFHGGVVGVRVDVLVTSHGRPVANLTRRSFELRDNGVIQDISVTPGSALPIDAILTVDASESVRGPKLDALRTAGQALLGTLTSSDRAELITFNQSVRERVPLTGDLGRIERGLATTVGTGETALVDASLSAILAGEANSRRTLVVMFSDGVDTASYSSPEVVLETARAASVIIYAIWSGSEKHPRFLADLTAPSGGDLIDVSGSGNVAGALLRIVREVRQRYAITYVPMAVASGGWHRLDIHVRDRNVTVKHRDGYFDLQ
jgi:VWFA-related protein